MILYTMYYFVYYILYYTQYSIYTIYQASPMTENRRKQNEKIQPDRLTAQVRDTAALVVPHGRRVNSSMNLPPIHFQ